MLLLFHGRVVTTDQALDHPVNRMTISQLLEHRLHLFQHASLKSGKPSKGLPQIK
jgi:hypothetical protein